MDSFKNNIKKIGPQAFATLITAAAVVMTGAAFVGKNLIKKRPSRGVDRTQHVMGSYDYE